MGNRSAVVGVSWRGTLFRDSQDGTVYPTAMVADLRHYGYNRIGVNRPNYRAVIRQGGNATNAMTVTVLNGETQDCDFTLSKRGSSDPFHPEFNKIYHSGMTGVHLSLNLPGPIASHYSSVSYDTACAKARRIVNRQLANRRRQFQGGVVAGELRKTIQMVTRPASSLRRAISSASRRLGETARSLQRSGASRNTIRRVVADTYLEGTFGWQPLLSDVRNGAIALARTASRDALERQQFRAHGIEEIPTATFVGNNYAVGYDQFTIVYFDREWRQKSVAECIIYGKFRTRLQDSSWAYSSATRLAELSGFSFADFIPTAWELMPWSFLVDYFTNVGDVIEAFSNCASDVAWAAEVHIQKSEEDFFSVLNQSKTAAQHGALFLSVSDVRVHAHSTRKTVVRTGAGVDLTTYLRLSLPGGLQWLNIAALLTGARPPKPFY
jgi:hypothetical protein